MIHRALLAEPLTFALIGSRSPDAKGERERLHALGAWLARRGIRCRSGGAVHADQAWADGVASVDPALLTVCLPGSRFQNSHQAPPGAVVLRPPYHPQYTELARREWEQLAPGPSQSWEYVVRHKPWLADLMIRNAAIVAPSPVTRVAMVLAVYPVEGDGGGTGHGIRLAQALGAHTVNLREPGAWEAAKPYVRAWVARSQTGVRSPLLGPAATASPDPAPRVAR